MTVFLHPYLMMVIIESTFVINRWHKRYKYKEVASYEKNDIYPNIFMFDYAGLC